jgi:tRNA A37 threonylcarbamoyltransferase TsaD
MYVKLFIPERAMATDNAIMIACAAYIDHLSGKKHEENFRAEGTMSIT